MRGEQIITSFLVLRKTPYQESSLIVAGVSPEGQVHFLVRGARKLSRKQFPVADLFRVLDVQYNVGRSDLHTWRIADVAEDYAEVARDPTTYQAAVWLARFALANFPHTVPQPSGFQAMVKALERLAKAAGTESAGSVAAVARIGVSLVFLAENGLLPHYPEDAQRESRRKLLLKMALGRHPVPKLKPEDYDRLEQWTHALLHHADCHVPGEE